MTEHRSQRVSRGDRVRVDIPDETHPDHDTHHGRHGRVIAVIPESTADADERTYRVDFDGEGYADFPRWLLRPPIVE